MLSPLPLPVEERKGSREKVKADADNPHAPVYARRPVGRLGTCPYWYGVGRLETCAPTGTGWAGWKPAPTGTAGGQVGNLPLLVREREGRRGGQGEGEGHQACSAAQALKPLNPCVSARRRRMRYRSRIKAR